MNFRMETAVSGHASTMVAESRKQRRHFRQKIHNLAYINLNFANGGIIRNVSQSGIAIQAVSALQEDQEVQLRFELLNPRTRVEATGRVVWTDSSGQAGLEFIAVATRARLQLKEWLFTQLLGSAAQSASSETIFVHRKTGEQPRESAFPATSWPALRLQAEVAPAVHAEETVPWWPVPQSPRTLARLIDGLIVASAVLLFCVLSLAITHVFPTWWLGTGLVLAAGAVFAGVYWVLFGYCVGMTPGSHLARLAGGMLEDRTDEEAEEATRFR
jgi:hypothetical protein